MLTIATLFDLHNGPEGTDQPREIVDVQDDPVPPTGLLPSGVGDRINGIKEEYLEAITGFSDQTFGLDSVLSQIPANLTYQGTNVGQLIRDAIAMVGQRHPCPRRRPGRHVRAVRSTRWHQRVEVLCTST